MTIAEFVTKNEISIRTFVSRGATFAEALSLCIQYEQSQDIKDISETLLARSIG